MPTYLAYRKRMLTANRKRLIIRGTDADVASTKEQLCRWLENAVAPCLPFLLPPPSDKERRDNALANMARLKLLDLLYMIAVLQEVHGVPPFPNAMGPCKGWSSYSKPGTKELEQCNSVPPYLALVPSRESGAGLGIVNASKDQIPGNEHLGYYKGLLMKVEQGERLAYKKKNAYIMFVRDPKDGLRQSCINARNRITSTWTRFMNERQEGGSGEENMLFTRSDSDSAGDPKVRVATTKVIHPGQELLARYR